MRSSLHNKTASDFKSDDFEFNSHFEKLRLGKKSK